MLTPLERPLTLGDVRVMFVTVTLSRLQVGQTVWGFICFS